MQTDETRAREVLADLMKLRVALNTGRRLNDPAEVYLLQKTLDQLEMLAFAAPPAVEREGCTADLTELIGLLRREGRYGGFWFGDKMLHAANLLETLYLPHQADREAIAKIVLEHLPHTWASEDALRTEAYVEGLADAILALSPTPSAGWAGDGEPEPELVEIIRQWLMSTDHNVSDWERQFAVAIEAMMTASGWQRPILPPATEKAER